MEQFKEEKFLKMFHSIHYPPFFSFIIVCRSQVGQQQMDQRRRANSKISLCCDLSCNHPRNTFLRKFCTNVSVNNSKFCSGIMLLESPDCEIKIMKMLSEISRQINHRSLVSGPLTPSHLHQSQESRDTERTSFTIKCQNVNIRRITIRFFFFYQICQQFNVVMIKKLGLVSGFVSAHVPLGQFFQFQNLLGLGWAKAQGVLEVRFLDQGLKI